MFHVTTIIRSHAQVSEIWQGWAIAGMAGDGTKSSLERSNHVLE